MVQKTYTSLQEYTAFVYWVWNASLSQNHWQKRIPRERQLNVDLED